MRKQIAIGSEVTLVYTIGRGHGNINEIDTHHACVTRRKPFEHYERELTMGRAMLIATVSPPIRNI